MGISWTEYLKMPYNAAMAAWEGYQVRVEKMDANFREVAWRVLCSFADPKDPKFPKSQQKYWPLHIDNMNKPIKKTGVYLTKEQLIKIRNG